MKDKIKQQHILGLIMLSMTAIFWGAGFVLNDQLLTSAFTLAPNLLNALRFSVAAVVLAAIFARKLRFNKRTLLFGIIGGAMLFGGFTLQLIGLKYTTPSHNGFFTVAYIIFVPFITWIVYKKRPNLLVFTAIAIAIVGLIVLNLFGEDSSSPTLSGDLLTLAGSLLFAMQIVLTDYALKTNKIDSVNMTFWQVLFAAILFVLYTLIFESKHYAEISFDYSYCVWRLVIVSVFGTGFAYFSQSYAQKRLNSAETSIILSCESPIGMIISIAVGLESLLWNTIVGGLLVLCAAVLVEIVPAVRRKKDAPCTNTATAENVETTRADSENDTQENNSEK